MLEQEAACRARWPQLIPANDWALYRQLLEAACASRLPFAVGGAFGLSVYTGRWRYTKDLDLYVLPEHRAAMAGVVGRAGFRDYYDHKPYDRNWIYRSHRDGMVVDLIWSMANYHAQVDEDWLTRGASVEADGLRLPVISPEELLWTKLFIVQRERCDWPDLFNLLYGFGPALDWERLLRRLGQNDPVLAGLLSVFAWLCPTQAAALPGWVWGRLGLHRPQTGTDCADDRRRPALLDRLDWFGATSGEGRVRQEGER